MIKLIPIFAAVSLAATMFAVLAPAEADAASRACPVGMHSGYLGRHCWPNRHRICPVGTHLGYEGKHCWRNH